MPFEKLRDRSNSGLDVALRSQQWDEELETSSGVAQPASLRYRLNELDRDGNTARFVYQKWADSGSKTRFFCNGRLMTGPKIDTGYNVCAWVCILIPCIMYFVLCAPALYSDRLWYFPVLTFIVLVLCVIFFLLTSFSDPGIIPRDSMQRLSPGLDHQIYSAIGYEPPDVGEDVAPLTQEQVALGFRYCRTCQIIRPPRASHCSDCDNCVMRFDHHCPFVNNCVGQRNYAFFSAFLLSVVSLGTCIVVGFCMWVNGNHKNMSEKAVFILSGIVVIPTVLLLLITAFFCMCHVFLVARGRTTREFLRPERVRASLKGTLFAGRGISFVRPRDIIPADVV